MDLVTRARKNVGAVACHHCLAPVLVASTGVVTHVACSNCCSSLLDIEIRRLQGADNDPFHSFWTMMYRWEGREARIAMLKEAFGYSGEDFHAIYTR